MSEERLHHFERCLVDLSVCFINLPGQDVDRQIDAAQSAVCECLGIDRSSLWQSMPEEPGRLRLTHLYQSPEAQSIVHNPDGTLTPSRGWVPPEPPPPPAILTAEAGDWFPWATRKCLEGETLVIARLQDLPGEAARDKESWLQFATYSILVFPLSAGGGEVFGILSFDMTREERDWPEPVVKRLGLVAQVFANAITRKRANRLARESEGQLSLAASAAGVGFWALRTDTGHLWITKIGRRIFGFPAEEALTFERFLDAVHPEDRKTVEEAASRAEKTGDETRVNYRIVRPDGTIRWIISRGRLQPDEFGRPPRLMGVAIDITERMEMERRLKEQLRENQRLQKQLHAEVVYLRMEMKEHKFLGPIIGSSDAMRYVFFRIAQVAPLDTTVLIQGETGTGKNLVAAAIHNQSSRKGRPLVTVSCASLPPNLIESELFGRERGAFTGADQRRVGRFEISDGSTIFLDEIGELPLDLQAKLLRVVQTGEFERLGSAKTVKVDVRIVAASNRSLDDEVRAGRFRADLFYRLNVFPITVPPLRERRGDIPQLVQAFLHRFAKKTGKAITTVPGPVLRALQAYSWPGNVRELESVIERAVILSPGPALSLTDPLGGLMSPVGEAGGRTLAEIERDHICHVLRTVGWRIQGEGGAAALLGLNPSTLRARMRKLGIRRNT